ncbi:hypothetical protein [Sphingobacterium sp.]|uniref:hypothetical protein n=1 Tax=Sphingobacterium sp. TaxID=341027 RepID=UPI0031D5771A
MTNKKLVLEYLLKDPLFWSVLLLNLLIVYLYGNDAIYHYNIVVAQSIQTFAYAVAHYLLLKNTPINYAVKKIRLNRKRKKSDKNRKSFGTYIEKDETGNWVYTTIFFILLCFFTVFLAAIVLRVNWLTHRNSFVFQSSDFYPAIWAVSNAIFYYKNNKARLTYSNASPSELVAVPFFKLYIPMFMMIWGYILPMKVIGDIVGFILSNPKYWKSSADNETQKTL